MSLVRFRTVFIICCIAAAFSLRLFARQSQTTQGVYTEQQASRGQAIYKERCATCHGDTLGGRMGPALTGSDFLSAWSQDSLFELTTKIRNTMPQTEPGTLTLQQAADVVAYILQAAKFPAGRGELGGDEAALKQIRWPSSGAAPAKPSSAAAQGLAFPPAGNLAQVMRGILFPSSNIIFTVQTVDPGEKKTATSNGKQEGGFNWMLWGSDIYKGWELVDYAAVALAESAPLMLTPGRRCENGKPVPVNDPEWIKYSVELAEAGKAAYKASQSRSQEAVSDVSSVVADACLHCHQVYRDRRGPEVNPVDPGNKAARCVK